MKKGKDFLKAFDYIDDEYLDLVEEMKVRKNKVWWKTGMAAAVCVGVLTSASAVAFASNVFGIKDLVIATEKNNTTELTEVPEGTEFISEDGKSKTIVTPEGDEFVISLEDDKVEDVQPRVTSPTIDLISLSGFSDSPEAKAAAEWMEFCDSYDKDGAIMDAHNYDEPGAHGEDVKLYSAYSDEMADKLREIASKYNLSFHKETDTMAYDEFESYFGGKLCAEATECYGAYFYDDGTVHFDASVVDSEGFSIDYQFGRNMKGIFDEVYLSIGNSEDYTQEEYTTKDGSKVILAISDYKGLIIIDKEKSFSVVNIMIDWYGKYEGEEYVQGEFTMDKLEAFADTFDFSLLK